MRELTPKKQPENIKHKVPAKHNQIALPKTAFPPTALILFNAISNKTISKIKANNPIEAPILAKQVVKAETENSLMCDKIPKTVAIAPNPAAKRSERNKLSWKLHSMLSNAK